MSPFSAHGRLRTLFFLQSATQALWYVPFSSVLRAHGLEEIIPIAFAVPAIAALVSPMVGGALADHHVPAERILSALCAGAGLSLAAVFWAIAHRWSGSAVLALLLFQQLLSAPTGSLIVAIILAHISHPEREYGPIRVWATYGWLVAVPALALFVAVDRSPTSGYVASVGFLAVSAFAGCLPSKRAATQVVARRWRDLLGSDTLELLRERNVRVVFITAALFSIPLAAYYPFTPLYLRDLGQANASAALSIGQATEVLATFALGPLLLWTRPKWVLLAGLCFGVARYGCFALGIKAWALLGIGGHGFCYTLYFVGAQLYLERRISAKFRGRAQAFLVFMMLGIGTLAGSLLCGALRQWCATPSGTDWPLYWSILMGSTAAFTAFFAWSFREEPIRLIAAQPLRESPSV